MFIHVGGADFSVQVTNRHNVFDFRLTLADERRQVLDVHARVRPLLELQMLVLVLGQQVSDLLLIDLQVGRSDKILFTLGRRRYVGENVIKRTRNDTFLCFII